MRNISLYSILLLFLTCGLSVQAQDYSKLSSHLRRMVHEQSTAATRGVSATGNSPRMVMLVRGEEETLAPYCLTHQGDLHLCLLSVDEASRLSLSPKINRIQATLSEVSACLDTLTKITNIDDVWQGVQVPQAYTGKGVLIGMPDAGLDYSHPAFRDEKDGHLRIVRAWDKLDLSSGEIYNTESLFPIGTLLTDPEKILEKGASVDSEVVTHATFTTSVAAGSSAGTPYRGVAYEAEIYSTTELIGSNKNVIDKRYHDYFTTELTLLTFSNIFAYADSIGQPCVINYSMGSDQDMTDAEIMEEQYLERLLTPGHILVSSAGNSGEDYRYLRKPAGMEYTGAGISSSKENSVINISTTDTLLMRFIKMDENDYQTYDIPLDMQIGDTLSTSGLRWYDFSEPDTLSAAFRNLSVSIYSGYDGFDSTRVGYDIFLNYPDKKLQNSKIAVQILGKEADAKIFIQNGEFEPIAISEPVDLRFDNLPKGLATLCSPASLPSVITVGATSHRRDWIRYDGVKRTNPVPEPHGERAYFSSCGPSLHGFMKPDVMAPGMTIVSALNNVYYQKNRTYINNRVTLKYAPDGDKEYQWAIDSGTSLSAPVVSGIIALWLQADPTLTADRVKEIFAKTCRQDDSMLTLLSDNNFDYSWYGHDYKWPNYECGYGEIDAYKGLLEVLKLPASIPSLSTRQLQEAKALPDGKGGLRLLFDAPLATSLQCSVYNVSGQKLYSGSLSQGATEYQLPLSEVSGIVVIQIDGLGSTLVRL